MLNTTYTDKLVQLGFFVLIYAMGASQMMAQCVVIHPTSLKTTKKTESSSDKKIISDKDDIFISFVIEDDIMTVEGDEKSDAPENHISTGVRNNVTSDTENVEENSILTHQNKMETLEVKLNVFPIPAQTYMNVTAENATIQDIQLLNATGQVVLSLLNENNEAMTRINVHHLQKGIYFMVMNTTNGKFAKNVVIQ